MCRHVDSALDEDTERRASGPFNLNCIGASVHKHRGAIADVKRAGEEERVGCCCCTLHQPDLGLPVARRGGEGWGERERFCLAVAPE